MPTTQRPQRADGEATRNRILEAAGVLFAEAGLAEATNKMIAAKAGADMASINYHFGNRNGLYQSVLIEAHHRLIDRTDVEALTKADIPAREKLRMLVEFLAFSASGKTRWPVVVLVRELIAPSSHIVALREVEVFPKLKLVLPVLSEITTIPASDPALMRCLPCIGAPCLAMLLLSNTESIFEPDVFHLPQADMADHLYHFIIGGLERIGDAYRAGRA
ncbi:MAG: DUF1956 domain-containing protein [Paracoccus denitrificans]|uniref:DUF1956 domain-containing protein n=1 Tax=Paracoccus denitrificans TaxID=266 RepID=A0A533IBC0_PARDE|nr:MAG: DUF1956 domain-containing protein [Paracoccus denitrificans]